MIESDYRQLRYLHSRVLEHSSSELSPELLLDVAKRSLRLCSKRAGKRLHSTWTPAKEAWMSAGAWQSAMQSAVYGTQWIPVEDRVKSLDALQGLVSLGEEGEDEAGVRMM